MTATEALQAAAVLGRRVVLLAPLGRDATVIGKALRLSAIDSVEARDISELAERVGEGAGAVLITEEVLTEGNAAGICALFADQSSWSDLPVLLLLQEGERLLTQADRRVAALRAAANVSVLVRPVPGVALVTAVQAALRARARQYEVHDLIQSEKAARREAEEANRLKDEFLATVSHELRTPLSAILVWSRLLVASKVEPRRINEALTSIERCANTQSRLIEDLLDVSRMVSGKLRLCTHEIELAPAAEQALAVVKTMADAKNIRLDSFVDPAAGRVFADNDRMQQIIWNLLGNAIKFTPGGGRVCLDLRRQDQHVAIRVEDSGEGIAPEFVPQVFERFRQADAASTRRHSGLGLGLAITKELVELHGGSLDVESAGIGKGAAFTVHIPLARYESPLRIEAPRGLEGVFLLLVEDEPATRAGLALVLEHAGGEVIATESASTALDTLNTCVATNRLPDVMLSDIGMPHQDGHSLMRAVRALPNRTSGIPSLALSAYSEFDQRERALQSGFQDYLLKPVDPQLLVNAVLRLVGRQGIASNIAGE